MVKTILPELEFDDAADKLYKRQDGGQVKAKGVLTAASYPDYNKIADKEAAALMVSLDIFRGVPLFAAAPAKPPVLPPPDDDMPPMPDEGPTATGFIFGADRLLARSAFERMLAKACRTPRQEVFKIPRSEGGLTVGEAIAMVAARMGKAAMPAFTYAKPSAPLNREAAVQLLAAALKASDGSGKLPYLYYVPANAKLKKLELPKNSVVAAPDGKLVTLTVNGVFQPLAGGWKYKGDLVLTLTDRYELYRYFTEPGGPMAPKDGSVPKEPALWNDFDQPYRAALFLENGKKVASRSIDSAYHTDAKGGIYIDSSDAPSNAYGVNDFNGIIVGSGKYNIKNLKVRFNGNSRDDFQGMGAALLLVGDETEVILENADINNYGTNRSTMVVGGNAKIMVKNSRFSAHDGIFEEGWPGSMSGPKMRQAPNCGGFEGNCRSTNLLDKAEANYFNSQIMSEKWGVLSTDNNKGVLSNVVNSYIGITGGLNEKVDTSSEAAARASLEKIPFREIYGLLTRDFSSGPCASGKHPGGYGTYSIGDTTVKFAGSTLTSADYANVCASENATVIYCASTLDNLKGVFGIEGLPVKVQNTVVYCDKTGVQIHRGRGGGGIIIKEGTVFHCGCHCFAVKTAGSATINVDNSTLISEMGVILQMMDEDDNMVGGCVEHIPPTAEDLAAAAALIRSGKWDVFTPREHHDSFVKYSNMTVNGDTFNSSGYSGRITEEELEKLARKAKNPFGGMGLSKYHSMNARHLCFTLENVVYNGAISTAEGFHIDRDTGLRLPAVGNAKWYCISVLQSEPKPVYQAGLILTMKQGSVWNVPKTCYLSSLTVDKTSRIAGRVYVDGSYVVPKAGVTYKGYITVQPGI